MWRRLLKAFGIGDRKAWEDKFDPIYGLPYPALSDWLARNPKLREQYEAELKARLTARG